MVDAVVVHGLEWNRSRGDGTPTSTSRTATASLGIARRRGGEPTPYHDVAVVCSRPHDRAALADSALQSPVPRRGRRAFRALAHLELAPDDQSSNEVTQLGLRLARRLHHGRVYAVDVPMNLWHDSIAMFDERRPDARGNLRRRWSEGFTGFDESGPDPSAVSLAAVLRDLNRDVAVRRMADVRWLPSTREGQVLRRSAETPPLVRPELADPAEPLSRHGPVR